MEIKPEPTVNEILCLFKLVINNEGTREDVSDYAMYYIRNDSIYDIRDKDVNRLLDLASGIDLMASPNEYLHCEQDIKDWINKYKEGVKNE